MKLIDTIPAVADEAVARTWDPEYLTRVGEALFRAFPDTSAEEVEELYASDVLPSNFQGVHATSTWGHIETSYLNSFFADNPDDTLKLQIPAGFHSMFSRLHDARLDVTGSLTNHLGWGAVDSKIKATGNYEYVGTRANGSDLVVFGNVTRSLGSHASGSSFLVIGDTLKDVGLCARNTSFVIGGNVGRVLDRGRSGSTAYIWGNAYRRMLSLATECVVDIHGTVYGSTLYRAEGCELTAQEIAGKNYADMYSANKVKIVGHWSS